MDCGTHFCTLLFIVAYAFCIVYVSCDNASLNTEIHESSPEKITANSTRSNNNLGLDNKHSDVGASETLPSEGINPVSLEGGSTVLLNPKKSDLTTTTKKSVQSESLNEKGLQLESDQYSMGESPSTDHKPHKGRKGVVEEAVSGESSIEHATLDTAKINKPVNNSVQPVNNMTNIATSSTSAYNNTMNVSSVTSLGSNKTNLLKNSTQLSVSGTNLTFNSNSTTTSLKSGEAHKGNNIGITEMPPTPRQKPEVTRDDSDVDDVSYSSYALTLTEKDYVIPIIATIFAAPLLIVLAMFLYKRSKEFWERRHYRRMDFLIDGMYND